ncbi:MAG: hypothetical protein K6L73_11340 [Cellvibrionaceae bacterium]
MLFAWLKKILAPEPAPYEGELKTGQIWQYRTRDCEPDSKLHIFLTDDDEKLGKIFHIRVEGLNLASAPNVKMFPHAPIVEKKLRQSVTELVGDNQNVPDSSVKAYLAWNVTRYVGDSGIFSIMVSEIAAQIEKAMAGKK